MMKKRITISILFAILFVILINCKPIANSNDTLINQVFNLVNGYGVFYSVSALSLGYCFYKLNYCSKYKKEFNIWILLLSLLLSVSLITGKYYINQLTIYNMYSSIVNIILNVLSIAVYTKIFYIVFYNLFKYIDEFNNTHSEKTENKFPKILDFILDKHSFIAPFIIIMLCGLPYIICFYPGTLQPDADNQLFQFLTGLRSGNHPFTSTILLGVCYKVGRAILNENFGVFVFTFSQFIFSSIVLAYSINLLKEMKAPKVLRLIALLYFSLFTIWPINAYTYVKDTMYYLIFLVIVMEIVKYIEKENYQKSIAFNFILMISCIALCMFRRNGMHVLLASLIPLLFLNKNKKRIILLALVITGMLIYNFFGESWVNERFKVQPATIKHALSLPMQQIALYTIRYGDTINGEDKDLIENLYNLPVNEIKNYYIPESADNVKVNFKYAPTKEELSKFFVLWIKYGIKHPLTYIDAFSYNYFGYFYPDRVEYKDGLGWYTIQGGFATFDDNTKDGRDVIEKSAYVLRNVPIIGLFYSTGLATWILFVSFTYLIYSKKYKYILILLPSFGTLVICCMSPVDAYIRYSLPIMVCLPLIIALMINYKNTTKESKLDVLENK